MTKVRIAVIGAGAMGKCHISAFGGSRSAELVAVVDSDPGVRAGRAGKGTPVFEKTEWMLREVRPDGVVVATPTECHLEPALTSIESGCHVLIEKPIAATRSEARRIALASEACNVHVLVGHHRRYYPLASAARETVRGGSLGQLVLVSGQWGVRKHDQYYSSELRRRRTAGPVLTNLSHELDMLRFVCGNLRSIHAEISNHVNGWEKEDAAVVTMQFVSGALGSFALSDQTNSPWAWEFATGENVLYPRSSQNSVRFMGTQASLDFPNLVLWRHCGSDGNWKKPIRSNPMETLTIDPFVSQIDHFCDVVAGRSMPHITAHDGIATLEATLAVFESAKSGKTVTLHS